LGEYDNLIRQKELKRTWLLRLHGLLAFLRLEKHSVLEEPQMRKQQRVHQG